MPYPVCLRWGGVTLERRVTAGYLARMLTGATASELGGRRVTRVAFLADEAGTGAPCALPEGSSPWC